MEINLNDAEVEEILTLIKDAWNDGFESEALEAVFEKLISNRKGGPAGEE